MSTFERLDDRDDETFRMWVADVTPGPAGSVPVVVGGVTLRLDALDSTLCAIDLDDLSGDDLRFLTDLFGAATARALAGGDIPVDVQADRSTPVWLAVRGLARSTLLAHSRRPTTVLQLLDTVLALQRLGHPAARAAARRHADAIRPAVTALARIARQTPEALDLPEEVTRQLVLLLRVLRAVFADPASGQSTPKPLDRLLDALAPSSDTKAPLDKDTVASLADRLEGAERLVVGAAPAFEAVTSAGPSSQKSATIDVTVTVDDIAPRLGAATRAFAGPVRVVGRYPGSLTVEAPLAAVPHSRQALARVRLHGPDGTLLASGDLCSTPDHFGNLPSATCLLFASADTDRVVQVAHSGVFVDLVPAEGPPAAPEIDRLAIQALSAARAQRSGKDALAAAQTGDYSRARSEWDRCAVHWRLAGDRSRAEVAETLRDVPNDPVSLDWLTQLLRALEAAATTITAAARAGVVTVDQLGLYLEAVDAVGDGLLAAAAARQAVAELTPPPDDDDERDDWRAEIRSQLEIAAEVCLRSGGFEAAEMARHILGRIVELG